MNTFCKTSLAATTTLLALLFFNPVARADNLSVTDVNAAGLALHWQSQIQADTTRDEVVDMHLHVHDDRATSYYEIWHDGNRETIGFDDIGPRGTPYGSKEAGEYAQLRKEILVAKGHQDVTVELITTPQTTLYALSGYGDVHAIDAETGRTRWKTRVGTPFQPSVGIAANNQYVVVLKGSTVYCLDVNSGNVEWSRLARHAPGGGVAVSNHFAYVTSVTGHLQLMPLATRGLPEKFFASSGPATVDPTVSPNTVSWATERGFFNVASSDESGRFLFRLKTNDKFLASGARAGDYLIVVSVYGKAYAVHEKDGVLGWEIALGEPVIDQPVSIGDNRLALISTMNNLMILDAKRGQLVPEWPRTVPGIREFVGASKDVLYFLDVSGGLVGLRRDTGSQVLRTAVGASTRVIPNNETDRMYLTDARGRLACIRELANVNPIVHGGDTMVAAAESGENPFAEAAETDPADAEDSYGKLSDPFGQTDPAPAADEDPFGQPMTDDKPDDPFADQPAGDPDDPFADEMPADDPDDPDDPFGDDSGTDPDDPFADDGGGDEASDDDSSDSDPDDPFGDG